MPKEGSAWLHRCLAATVIGIAVTSAAPAQQPYVADRVTVDWRRPVARFRPSEVFGVAVDGGTSQEVERLFLPSNRLSLRATASLRTSYRLRTELGIEAWHWTSRGQWSDPRKHQGYWTGDSESETYDKIGYGYRLPRRGDTHDEANDDGYSRIDDGSATTFWKSNPYLDSRYTGVAGDHADWVVIELPAAHALDGIEIDWAAPFARRYQVEYWVGEDEYTGRWVPFPEGTVSDGRGGRASLRLAATPVTTRFVRILMIESSHTAAPGSNDPRDAIGYAVAEIGLGRLTADGRLRDIVRHVPDPKRQTMIHVSSTDPWHRAIDRDSDTAQPSIVALRAAGVIGDAPLMLPVGVLYDTPDNMMKLLDHMRRRGVTINRVELGEEPDGQMVSAEDYGALYVELAQRIRSEFPNLALGGPSLVNGVSDTWLDPSPDESWTSHFFKYLKARQAQNLLNFFSFEYFPFDDVCGSASQKLRDQTFQMRDLYRRLDEDGAPKSIPWLITEFGYSAFGGAPLVQMPSALSTADIVGDFLERGGSGAFAYGLTPDEPIAGESRCAGRGNLMFWLSARNGHASSPMPSLQAIRLLTQDWALPGSGTHLAYPSQSSLADHYGHPWVATYALLRPDRSWSLLLVNRARRVINARIEFLGSRPVDPDIVVTQYSDRYYRWDHPVAGGRPTLDQPPAYRKLHHWNGRLSLPPMSLSVVTGNWRDRVGLPAVSTAEQIR